MTGNCLKGSRPILSFDSNFNVALANPTQNDSLSHLPLLKELFVHTFATPRTSRKIKPFVDRVMQFSFVDGRIWVRNYQIVKNEGKEDVGAVLMEGGEEEKVVDEKKDVGAKKQESKKRKSPVGGKFDKEDDVSLVEIGPRFVLNVIRIFDGSFGGRTLYENPEFVSPNMVKIIDMVLV